METLEILAFLVVGIATAFCLGFYSGLLIGRTEKEHK